MKIYLSDFEHKDPMNMLYQYQFNKWGKGPFEVLNWKDSTGKLYSMVAADWPDSYPDNPFSDGYLPPASSMIMTGMQYVRDGRVKVFEGDDKQAAAREWGLTGGEEPTGGGPPLDSDGNPIITTIPYPQPPPPDTGH